MLHQPSPSMKVRARRLGLFALLCVAGLLAIGSACDPSLQAIAVSGQKSSVAQGTAVQLKAQATFSDGSNSDVSGLATWSSADSAVATVSAAGLAMGLAPGKTTIAATYKGVTGSLSLTITGTTLTSVMVFPAVASIAQGTTQGYTAVGSFSDGTTQEVTSTATWSADQAVATLASPTPSTLTATGIAAGQTAVKAVFMGQSGGATLVVTTADLTGLTISPGDLSLARGTKAQLKATGTFSDHTNQDLTSLVTWQSADSTIADVTSAPAGSPFGLLTAKDPGTVLITAALGPIHTNASCTVTTATLVSIAVTPQGPVLAKGTSAQLSATGTFSDNTHPDLTGSVTWTSSQPGVGTVSGGPAGPAQVSAVAQGTATLTATFMGVSGTAALTVTDASLTAIVVTAASTALPLGGSTQLTATGVLSDNNQQDLTSQVVWHSNPPGAAQISSLGQLTTLSAGLASITATLGPTVSAPLVITTTNAALVSIAVTAQSAQIAKGTTTLLTAMGTYSDHSQLNLTAAVLWTVPDASQGLAAVLGAGQVKGIGVGVATIVATDPQSGVSGSTTVSVSGAVLSSIDVSAVLTSLPAGLTTQLTASGTFSDGSHQDLTSQVAWQGDPALVLIDARGLLTAKGPGQAGVTAVLGAVASAPLNITVNTAVLVSIAVTGPTQAIQIFAGGAVQLTATGTYSDGTKLPITSSVGWKSSSDVAVPLPTPGLISGVRLGVATVFATDPKSGISGSIAVSVTTAPLVTLALSAVLTSLPVGATTQLTAMGRLADGTPQDVTSQVTWQVVPPDLLVIDPSGLLTAQNPGQASVTAALGGIASNALGITVNAAALVSIAVTAPTADIQIAIGATVQLTATGTYSDKKQRPLLSGVVWQTSDPAVAVPLDVPAAPPGTITGVGPGVVIITATDSQTSISGTIVISVVANAPTLQGLVIAPDPAFVTNGGTLALTATGIYSDGSTQDLSSQVHWDVQNDLVATISNAAGSHGLVTGLTVGSTTMSANLSNIGVGGNLTVTPAPVPGIVDPIVDTLTTMHVNFTAVTGGPGVYNYDLYLREGAMFSASTVAAIKAEATDGPQPVSPGAAFGFFGKTPGQTIAAAIIASDPSGGQMAYQQQVVQLIAKRLFRVDVPSGDLGGVGGADTTCQGTGIVLDVLKSKAVLSNGTTRMACTSANCSSGWASENRDWALLPGVLYTRMDGTPIAGTNPAGIFEFPLEDSLESVPSVLHHYWMGLNADWTSNAANCHGWGPILLSSGAQGINIARDSGTIYVGLSDCLTASGSLLCAEQ